MTKKLVAAMAGASIGVSAALAETDQHNSCTTGISVEGILDGLEVYGAGDEPIGETEDIVIARNGAVLALRAEVGGFLDIGDTTVSIPWNEVEVGETWARTPLIEGEIDEFELFGDERLVSRILGEHDASGHRPDALRASELIGDFVRAGQNDQSLSPFAVVDNLIIHDGRIAAVVIAPDAGLGLAETYAIPFSDYLDENWSPSSAALDLTFERDEVEEIGAFAC